MKAGKTEAVEQRVAHGLLDRRMSRGRSSEQGAQSGGEGNGLVTAGSVRSPSVVAER